jgi:hypothetical protein
MANFTVSDGSNSVNLDLFYNYISDNTWSAGTGGAGQLPVDSGTWTSSQVAKRVIFRTSSGSQVMYFDGVPISASVGYPFDGIAAGTTGDGLILMSGGVLGASSNGVIRWTFNY